MVYENHITTYNFPITSMASRAKSCKTYNVWRYQICVSSLSIYILYTRIKIYFIMKLIVFYNL